MSYNESVAVTIVTFNSGRYIKRCLEAALDEGYDNKEIVVIDNASTDGTTDILEQFESRCRVIYNQENIGFAAAQNQAIAITSSDWVLTLNPDVLLMPNCIRAMTECGRIDPRVGTVCGKLLTIKSTYDLPDQPLIDSTGIYFTPMLRHLDRGSQQVDDGRYPGYEYVFGATAAAALYRRTMIDDVAVQGEFFDNDFFVYREDADVAWRAQLLGWRCVFTPHARGYHVRKVLPGNRRALPADINMHSVKNRFLMRLKNITPGVYWQNWLSILYRDVVVLSCCLLREHSSLKAFWFVARNYRKVMAKRRDIMSRRRVTDEYLTQWFSFDPVSRPAPKPTLRMPARNRTTRFARG